MCVLERQHVCAHMKESEWKGGSIVKCKYKWWACDWWRVVLIVQQLGAISYVLAGTTSSAFTFPVSLCSVFTMWINFGYQIFIAVTFSVVQQAIRSWGQHTVFISGRGDGKTAHVSISAQQAIVERKRQRKGSKKRNRESEESTAHLWNCSDIKISKL